MNRLTDEQRTLADQNRGIAYAVAKRFYRRCRCIEEANELASESLLALCCAAREWNASREVKFTIYAWQACTNRIRDFLACDSTIVTPAYLAHAVNADRSGQQWRSVARQTCSLGRLRTDRSELAIDRDPSDRAICRELMAEVRKLPREQRHCVRSWMKGVSGDETGKPFGYGREWSRRRLNLGFDTLRQKFGVEVA